jgi:peroxiredoxin Q/BCP
VSRHDIEEFAEMRRLLSSGASTASGLGLIIVAFISLPTIQVEAKPAEAAKAVRSTKPEAEAKAMANKIGLNDRAPDLFLPDQNGRMISLKDFQGNKVVVVYFYPKDETSICTAEACSFRDNYIQFKELGAEVVGVSSDTVQSHRKFADKHHLQFSLLADTSDMARKAFGVPHAALIMPGRVTYVIDKKGVVRYVFNSMMDGPRHMTEAMKVVKDLSKEQPDD